MQVSRSINIIFQHSVPPIRFQADLERALKLDPCNGRALEQKAWPKQTAFWGELPATLWCAYPWLIYQSINQSINQSIYQSINESINLSMNLSIYQWIYQSINESINLSINPSINPSIHRDLSMNPGPSQWVVRRNPGSITPRRWYDQAPTLNIYMCIAMLYIPIQYMYYVYIYIYSVTWGCLIKDWIVMSLLWRHWNDASDSGNHPHSWPMQHQPSRMFLQGNRRNRLMGPDMFGFRLLVLRTVIKQ